MSLEQFANLAEIIGAIAVVVTLIYLAVQLKQNTAGIRATAYQTWLSATIAEQSVGQNPAMSEIIATGLFDPASLTEKNWVPFANYCHTFILKAESTYFLQMQGVVEKSVCEKEFERAASFLAVAGPSQWWKAGARTQFTSEFVSMIEPRIGQPSELQVYDFTPGRGFHPHSQSFEKADKG